MNSYWTSFREEAASRIWLVDSGGNGGELASDAPTVQAFSSGSGNKIKAIGALDKYFLTISARQFGIDGRCEPTQWLQ
jgi:hypothetical protein